MHTIKVRMDHPRAPRDAIPNVPFRPPEAGARRRFA
jgi:hypothetical protein